MKKLIKILSVAVVLFVILVIGATFALKSKADTIIKNEINKTISTNLNYNSLSINIFKNFPEVFITIKDITLDGVAGFSDTPLLKAGEITISANILSLFKNDNYEINNIILKNIDIYALRLQDRTANWDIIKQREKSAAAQQIEDTAKQNITISNPLIILFKNIKAENVNTIYDDNADNIYKDVKNLNFTTNAKIDNDNLTAQIELNANVVAFKSQDTLIIENAPILGNFNISANPKDKHISININSFSIKDDNADVDNMTGIVQVSNNTITAENVSFNTLDGNVLLNGAYLTENKLADINIKADHISFKKAYNNRGLIRTFAPFFVGIEGYFSTDTKLQVEFSKNVTPNLQTISGMGTITSDNISIGNVKLLNDFAIIFNTKELNNITAEDIAVSFTIANGRVTTKPFTIKSNGNIINLSGSTGFDETIDYKGEFTPSNNITSKIKFDKLGFNVKGTFKEPIITIDSPSFTIQTEELLKNAKEKTEEFINKALKGLESLLKDTEKEPKVENNKI